MRWIAARALAVLPGCAQRQQQEQPSAAQLEAEAPAGRYRASGMVLENVSATGPKHGPQLCAGARTSLPPQCSGLDIVNWSWDGVPHESQSGAKWGSYELIVTFDGTKLTLAEPPKPPPSGPPGGTHSPTFTTPCAAPPGGWRPIDSAKSTQAAFQEALRVAQHSPDYAGSWIDQNQKELNEANANNPEVFILNVRYTGNLATHEAELRKVWGGSLCLSQAARSSADLVRIQSETRDLPGVIGGSEDITTGTVNLHVWVASEERQRMLDQKYGPGTVVQTAFLTPVP